jgi:hypothetical protein
LTKHNARQKAQPANSTYKKLAVQWLNEVQFFPTGAGLLTCDRSLLFTMVLLKVE